MRPNTPRRRCTCRIPPLCPCRSTFIRRCKPVVLSLADRSDQRSISGAHRRNDPPPPRCHAHPVRLHQSRPYVIIIRLITPPYPHSAIITPTATAHRPRPCMDRADRRIIRTTRLRRHRPLPPLPHSRVTQDPQCPRLLPLRPTHPTHRRPPPLLTLTRTRARTLTLIPPLRVLPSPQPRPLRGASKRTWEAGLTTVMHCRLTC